jgi:hypothetical protein
MKKKAKASLKARGKKIMAAAKKIRKAHPGMKWTSCVSKAAKK